MVETGCIRDRLKNLHSRLVFRRVQIQSPGNCNRDDVIDNTGNYREVDKCVRPFIRIANVVVRNPVFLQVYTDVTWIDIAIVVDGILGNGVPIGVDVIEWHVFPDHYTTMEIIGDRIGNNPVILGKTFIGLLSISTDIDTMVDITQRHQVDIGADQVIGDGIVIGIPTHFRVATDTDTVVTVGGADVAVDSIVVSSLAQIDTAMDVTHQRHRPGDVHTTVIVGYLVERDIVGIGRIILDGNTFGPVTGTEVAIDDVVVGNATTTRRADDLDTSP